MTPEDYENGLTPPPYVWKYSDCPDQDAHVKDYLRLEVVHAAQKAAAVPKMIRHHPILGDRVETAAGSGIFVAKKGVNDPRSQFDVLSASITSADWPDSLDDLDDYFISVISADRRRK